MKNLHLWCKSLFVAFALLPTDSIACTSLQVNGVDGAVVGKNNDWFPLYDHVGLYVNKRGIEKRAVLLRAKHPVHWVSRYGSVTFNQMGREFPNGGMNEAGLVVENLMLQETRDIPASDPQPALNEGQWLQYLLDTASDLDEAIAMAREVRIERAFIKTHYFICDAKDQCAALEYLNGQLVVSRDSDLPLPLLANGTYASSMQYLHEVKTRQRRDPRRDPGGLRDRSNSRFARAALLLETLPSRSKDAINTTFKVLGAVKADSVVRTNWTVVYSPQKRSLVFNTYGNSTRRTLSLEDFDFSCRKPTLMADIAARGTLRLRPYSKIANTILVDMNWPILSAKLRAISAAYPEKMTRCLE